jgi:hypothetical protein
MTAPAFQTADRRARGARPPLPRLRAVLLEQVRATGLALRGPALIAAALLALLTLWVALQSVSTGVDVSLNAWPTQLPGLVGALLPIAVWARDERFGPGFLWTLPVDRRRHALTKVLAGWVWLMGGVALFVLWLLALTLATGGRVLPETLHVLPFQVAAAGPIDPAALRTVRWAPGPLIWAVPFTAATALLPARQRPRAGKPPPAPLGDRRRARVRALVRRQRGGERAAGRGLAGRRAGAPAAALVEGRFQDLPNGVRALRRRHADDPARHVRPARAPTAPASRR